MDDARLYSLETAACRGQVRAADSSQRTPWRWSASSWGLRRWAFERAATNSGKAAAGERAGELVMDLLRKDVTPLKILTKTAIENAIAGVAASGRDCLPESPVHRLV